MNVVITGASKGIGLAIAKQFAALGYTLFICSRNAHSLYKAVDELYAEFPQTTIRALPVDLSTREGCDQFSDWVLKQVATVDILVNNAGLFEPGSVHNEAEGVLDRMLQTNLYSAYHVTRKLVPGMVAHKSGHIFNICSIASVQAYANGGGYSISKFAMYGFGKNLREELKPHLVKVTNVLPGSAYTDSWSGSNIDPKRLMEADDIAKMVAAAAQLSPQACVEDLVLRPQLGDL